MDYYRFAHYYYYYRQIIIGLLFFPFALLAVHYLPQRSLFGGPVVTVEQAIQFLRLYCHAIGLPSL